MGRGGGGEVTSWPYQGVKGMQPGRTNTLQRHHSFYLSLSMDILQVSIVARQQGSVLTHYHTKSGDSLELLYPGDMSAEVRKLIWSLPNSPWRSHLVSIQLTTKATTSKLGV